jgi:hypothetical protein
MMSTRKTVPKTVTSRLLTCFPMVVLSAAARKIGAYRRTRHVIDVTMVLSGLVGAEMPCLIVIDFDRVASDTAHFRFQLPRRRAGEQRNSLGCQAKVLLTDRVSVVAETSATKAPFSRNTSCSA